MFNLIVRSVAWDTGRESMPVSRVFEYTDDEIADQFKVEGNPALDRLARLPCLFMPEGVADEPAYVGSIIRARIANKELSFEYALDRDIPPLTNGFLQSHQDVLGMGDFEFSRNHWAVKDIDLYRFLLQNFSRRRQRPTIFQIPDHENIEPVLASAMMPFDAAFTSVYDSVRQAATNAGMQCRRADDIWENAAIIQDVVSLIDRSRVVVCDCTGRNPNVFYETGIAHTLGREVILIAQSDADIPFDLRHLRYVRYHDNGEGRLALTAALEGRMQTILGH